MGGVAGHAGLFSAVDDLAIFAQMVLDGGSRKGVQILSPLMVEKMTTPQSPHDRIPLMGLGWNIDSPLVSVGSFGQRDFTGTGIWIDPVSPTYVIILINRVHPNGKGNAEPLRTKVLSLVSEVIGITSRTLLSNYCEQGNNNNGKMQTGIAVSCLAKAS